MRFFVLNLIKFGLLDLDKKLKIWKVNRLMKLGMDRKIDNW